MDWKSLYEGIFEALKEETKELWEEGKENLPWLQDIAARLAEHAFKSRFGPEAERELHKEAIEDLKASVEIRLRSESIRIKLDKMETFRIVIMTTIRVALKIVTGFVFPTP